MHLALKKVQSFFITLAIL
jgi:hypothetical protein